MTLLHPVLALVDAATLGALVPFGIMGTVVIIWVCLLTSRNQKKKMHYDMIRFALEKGLPIPAELQKNPDDHSSSKQPDGIQPSSDLRSGLIWLAVGAGIFVWQTFKAEPDWTPTIGAIPGFVGLALIVSYFIESRAAQPPVSPAAKNPASTSDAGNQP